MFRTYIVIGLIVVLCGCGSIRQWQYRASARARIDESACTAKGGSIKGVGMFGTPACVLPFADGGKACADKADCQGRCLIMEGGTNGAAPSAAMCQRDDQLFGCWQEVLHGQAQPAICVD